MIDVRQKLTFDEAVERARFQLTYRRQRQPRRFTPSGISGDRIHNAFKPGWAPGEWCQDLPDSEEKTDWLRYFLRAAVNEAVHEALEWFQVDGKVLLDPHDPRFESDIYKACDKLADEFWTILGEETTVKETD